MSIESTSNLLAQLRELKIESLMVEGGAQIITSFLKHRMVDQLVLTIAPIYRRHAGRMAPAAQPFKSPSP